MIEVVIKNEQIWLNDILFFEEKSTDFNTFSKKCIKFLNINTKFI